MDIKQIMNSPGLWIACVIPVSIVVFLSFYYFFFALKRAKILGISKERYRPAIRSAVVTSIGPSLSPVIVLVSMIALIGAPASWAALNKVGAARTELAMATMACQSLGVELGGSGFGVEAFTYVLWAMTLNEIGWFVVSFLMTHRMDKAVTILNEKYDRKWINMLMAGATLGVTGYLLSNQIISKLIVENVSFLVQMQGLIPAGVSATVMLLIYKFGEKNQTIQELSIGIAMLSGMFVAQLIYGM